MNEILIKAKDICKTFVNGTEHTHVIKNINMEINRGEFTVIMGSSGSGKSTLLYLLSGLDNVTAGEITFEDKNINKLNENKLAYFRRDNVGFIFQAINLVPNLSLFENIAIPGYLTKAGKKKIDERTEKLLETMEIKDIAERLPSQVSGGQQQRAAISRGLINNPKVLFADEPTGALNSLQGQNVLDILTEINSKGQTVVMVTHDLKAASRADRIVFLRDGKIAGELQLTKYSKDKEEQREKQIFAYVSEMGW